MKRFAHPAEDEKKMADINEALQNTLTVSRNEWKYVADVETDLESGLEPLLCFPDDLNQVFLNVIVNAAHAIADKVEGTTDRGHITVQTRAGQGAIEVRIGDTGTGIPEANRNRVFDPFFTTKRVGKGTGQGLSIAYSIVVDKHHGEISFESEVGRGTTFIIRLPLAGRPEEG